MREVGKLETVIRLRGITALCISAVDVRVILGVSTRSWFIVLPNRRDDIVIIAD